jgi:hypothetical protein
MNAEGPRVKLAGVERFTLTALTVAGAIAAVAGAATAPDRMWASVLLVSYYIIGVALAGLCFVAIHYTAGASWSVAVRRVAEALAGTLLPGLVLLAIVLAVRPQLYPWVNPSSLGSPADTALAFKRFWLSRPFFLVRAATYSVIWMLFALAIRRCSRRQDTDGDRRWTRANIRLSAAFLVIFAVTFTLASMDWVMSLEPLWYSTIFGVYNFSGLFESGLAALILAALWLERQGPLRDVLNDEHLHDLGKLLFAFSIFWVYIWFSQYMLVWYTNIPEETTYFLRRTHGWWHGLFIANVALNWFMPFVLLLRREARRDRRTLGFVAALVLVGRWLDLYLMIFPTVAGQTPRIGVWEIGLTAGGIGCFGLALVWILRGAPAVPIADPQLTESLHYEQ